MVGLKMTGGAELARALQALPEAVRKPVLVEGLKAAGESMRLQMQSAAPRSQTPPHVQENIVIAEVNVVEGVRVHDNEAAVAIGPAKKQGRTDFFYSLFLEFGTFRLPARPFVSPAFHSGVTQAFQTIGAHLWSAIRRATGS